MKIRVLNYQSVKKPLQKLLQNKTVKQVGKYLGFAVLAFVIIIFLLNLAYRNRIFPKTYVGTNNFGGLTQEEAASKLRDLVDSNRDGQLKFVFEDKNFYRKISDLDVDYSSQSDKTVSDLVNVGRKGSPWKIFVEQIKMVFTRNKVVVSYSYNDEKLADFLDEIAKTIDCPEKDATVAFKANYEPYVEPEKIGRKFPLPENEKIALQTIGTFAFSTDTPFLVQTIKPKIDSKMAEQALAKTRELLTRSLVMKTQDKEFKIETKDIPGLLEFITPNPNVLDSSDLSAGLVPQFSHDKVGEFLDNISKDINQEAKDPQFKVEGGRVVNFQVAQTGYQLEKEEAIKVVIAALNQGTATVSLPVKTIDPTISSNDPSAAGITELVAEGKTSWRGSPPNRIYNLSLGASKISGTIVKPGEEFSALKAIGEIGPSTGFRQELVIKKGNQVVPDYGGGLCQVSTTLFRAALNAGLKITARTAHSFRVSYYEPPVGMDATIFDPAPDFRFINDMKTPILIWAYAGNNYLTFQIYGTKDGRKVELSTPVTFNYVPPPEPVYVQSSTMAPGTIRQVEKALSGLTASFNYKVTAADGSILENQTFTSKYIALADSYLYGEGYPVPGVQGTAAPTENPSPTPTPEPTPTPTP